MASHWIDFVILGLMILIAGWISSQFGQLQGRTAEAFIASNYQTMAIIAMIVAAAGSVAFLKFEGFNKDFRQALPLLLIGAAVGFLMTSSGKLIFNQILSNPGAIDPTLSFTFVVVLAVFVEEYFFRATLFPSVERFVEGRTSPIIATIIAAVAVSATFAIWHLVATSGDTTRITSEFIFSMIQIGLLKATGSIAAPLGSHFMRNIMTFQ